MTPALALVPEEQSPYPQHIHNLDQLFWAEIDAIKQQHALFRSALAAARTYGCSSVIQEPSRELFETLWETITVGTLRHAESSLSSPGLAVDCQAARQWLQTKHHHQIREAFRHDRDEFDVVISNLVSHYAVVNPFTLWDVILTEYPPARIKDLAMEKAAKRFISTFGLRRCNSVKTTGRHVELVTRVWTDKKYRTDQRELHYNAREEFNLLAAAFLTLQETADIPQGVYDIAGLAQTYKSFCEYGFAYDSRTKYHFAGDIVLTLFNTEFKLHLPHPLAAALNLLIAEHGDIND